MGGERIDNEEFYRLIAGFEFVCEIPGVLHEKHLVIGRVSPGDMDIVQELLGIRDVMDAKTLDHLLDTLGAERVLGIDIDHTAIKAALLFGQLDVDCHLVDDLAFTGTKLTVHLGDRLGFQAATEERVDSGTRNESFLMSFLCSKMSFPV